MLLLPPGWRFLAMSAGEGVKRFWARVVAEVWRRDVMLSLWVLFALGEEEVVWIVDWLLMSSEVVLDDGGGG